MAETDEKSSHVWMAAKVLSLMVAVVLAGTAAGAGAIAAAILYFMARGNSFPQALEATVSVAGTLWVTVPYIVAQNVLFVAIAVLFARLIDRRTHPRQALGLEPALGVWRRFFTGLGVGLVLILGLIAILVLSGITTFEATGFSEFGATPVAVSSAAMIVASLFVAAGEEIVFRGYLQNTLARRYGVAAGLIVTSILFALLHTVGYATPIPLAGVFMASLVMGYLLVVTGSLYASVGFHFIWDYLFIQVFALGRPAVDLGSCPLLLFSSPGDVVASGYKLGAWDDLISAIMLAALLLLLYVYRRGWSARAE